MKRLGKRRPKFEGENILAKRSFGLLPGGLAGVPKMLPPVLLLSLVDEEAEAAPKMEGLAVGLLAPPKIGALDDDPPVGVPKIDPEVEAAAPPKMDGEAVVSPDLGVPNIEVLAEPDEPPPKILLGGPEGPLNPNAGFGFGGLMVF